MFLLSTADSVIVTGKPKKIMPTKEEKNIFSCEIEETVIRLKTSYIEAITHHCEQIGLEVEIAATLVNDTLKVKIEAEAQNLRYIPRESKLPI